MWKYLESGIEIPSLEIIETALCENKKFLVETPVWEWKGEDKDRLVGNKRKVFCKLELLQETGSFKPRGALCVMKELNKEQLARGVTCVSAGNHALAVAYSAKILGTSAHVVMPKTASKLRLSKCRAYGAQISLADDISKAFEMVKKVENEEKRFFVHPFDGKYTALGTATLGLEFIKQVKSLSSVIVPVGGGGLCAGISLAVKQLNPSCKIIGVEPTGANSLQRSFASGQPEHLEKVETIADSLGSPYALEYSFKVCQHFVDEVICISDDSIKRGMGILFGSAKLAVEPAGAVAIAALIESLPIEKTGENVGIIVCGANIDPQRFCDLLDDTHLYC
jgi:threonine dehydratase